MTVGFEFYSSGCTSYSDCLQLVILIVILHREDQDSIRIKLGRLHFVVGFFGLWWGWGGWRIDFIFDLGVIVLHWVGDLQNCWGICNLWS
jgi:hypothetical protein